MVTVTKRQLHAFLSNGGPGPCTSYDDYRDSTGDVEVLDEATFNALSGCDLRSIIADRYLSELHLGGDDLVAVVEDVLAAQRAGYSIAAWYGPNAEALVVGYRPDRLAVSQPLWVILWRATEGLALVRRWNRREGYFLAAYDPVTGEFLLTPRQVEHVLAPHRGSSPG